MSLLQPSFYVPPSLTVPGFSASHLNLSTSLAGSSSGQPGASSGQPGASTGQPGTSTGQPPPPKPTATSRGRKSSGKKSKTKPLRTDNRNNDPSDDEGDEDEALPRKAAFLQVTKREREKWNLSEGEDIRSTNTALITHIRILAEFFEEISMPMPTPEHLIEQFNTKFSTNAIYDGLSQPVSLTQRTAISEKVAKLTSATNSRSSSSHLRNMSKVPTSKLTVILTAVCSFGLSRWWPDYTGNFNTPYNNAHRAVALSTFQEAVATHAYNHLCPLRSQANNIDLTTRMYDHYVHYYLKQQVVAELKTPGSAKTKLVKTNTYKRRSKLQRLRVEYLQQQGYPPRIVDLFGEPECVSEDERDPQTGILYKIKKPGRSARVSQFAAKIDEHRVRNMVYKRGSRQPDVRQEAPPERDLNPTLHALPSNKTPIDWFDPEWFNARDVEIRKEYMGQVPIVALPRNWQVFFDGPANMADAMKAEKLVNFMAPGNDGNTIYSNYTLPSTTVLRNVAGQHDEQMPELSKEQKEQAELLKAARTRKASRAKDPKGKRKARDDEDDDDDEEEDGPSKKRHHGDDQEEDDQMDEDSE
ncbi:hypothetical protein K435DRAFT_641821 [Dendrothele bispora CBS 962.96]|uniref:Uncharacterized protein n=1 Tax=Dendrothele bispora (strain CBS 962.96) TaxID=1314807 RepID=A0A4S8MXY8_DENBC|nr:hypothetical protein K435DRAFT_641821 [Dendrothele bispora CBS 962.96]